MTNADVVNHRYNDSVDEDWVIGYHPTVNGILFATACNGHAYKVSFHACERVSILDRVLPSFYLTSGESMRML